MNIKAIFFSLLIISPAGFADDFAEEIVVTGMRASDSSEIPAVTLKKPADYFVQTVSLINDSRAPDLRKKEIIDTISHILAASKKLKG
jgi:hypothetical protein